MNAYSRALTRAVACLTLAPAVFASRPNIVFILLDDLGPADTGCYGSTAIHTPYIDRLAQEGIRFTQAYSGGSVCGPTRSTLMTGQHTGHTTVRGNSGGIPLSAGDLTVATL
jgi:arylsulfatase A-like enzyme